MFRKLILIFLLFTGLTAHSQIISKAVPDKLVVLTFDDAVLSHFTNVAPLLKQYKFGGTFFISEFLKPAFSDKTLYLSWPQISKLNKMGFEIANHTQNHTHVNKMDAGQFTSELAYIENRARAASIKKPLRSFAYPGYSTHPSAINVLHRKGYGFARVGGSRVYNPVKDHPLLIPSFSTSADNREQIFEAFEQAKNGNVVVLTIHGVPDDAHPWVTTPLNLFKEYLEYLHRNHYKVIALRDLTKYINPEEAFKILSPDFTQTMK